MKKQIIAAAAVAALIAVAQAQAHEQMSDDDAVAIEPNFVITKSASDCDGNSNYPPAAASNHWLAKALGAIDGGSAGSGATRAAGDNSNRPTCQQVVQRVLNGYVIYTSGGQRIFLPLSLVRQYGTSGAL